MEVLYLDKLNFFYYCFFEHWETSFGKIPSNKIVDNNSLYFSLFMKKKWFHSGNEVVFCISRSVAYNYYKLAVNIVNTHSTCSSSLTKCIIKHLCSIFFFFCRDNFYSIVHSSLHQWRLRKEWSSRRKRRLYHRTVLCYLFIFN